MPEQEKITMLKWLEENVTEYLRTLTHELSNEFDFTPEQAKEVIDETVTRIGKHFEEWESNVCDE